MVLMMGALHIEDKAQQMVGKILRDSGWTSILSRAQILTTGRVQSALNENHIKRTRSTHQVSVVSLKYLKHLAYIQYCSCVLGPPKSFDMWDRQTCVEVPQFKYWSTIIDLELLLCRFVRSLREGDFVLYVQVCDELCSWFHMIYHTSYDMLNTQPRDSRTPSSLYLTQSHAKSALPLQTDQIWRKKILVSGDKIWHSSHNSFCHPNHAQMLIWESSNMKIKGNPQAWLAMGHLEMASSHMW